jgi:arsenical pump membrane protein
LRDHRHLTATAFPLRDGEPAGIEPPPLRFGLGAAATLAAGALAVALPNAAAPVLAVGLTATILRRLRPRLDPRALALLFLLTTGLGTLGRTWRAPTHLLNASGTWMTAAIGVIASLLLNNLPAAVLLSARPPAHPDALLLGLNLGPNLAVTGSLSAVLWLQAARSVEARPSITTYTRLGLILVPLTLTATLAGLVTTRL